MAVNWWPVDKVIVGYLVATAILIVCWFGAIPGAWWLLALHVAAIAGLLRFRSNEAFHCWYPLLYVAACYKEMAILIPPIRGTDFDAALSRLDSRIWGVDPTLWLAAHQIPALT